MLLRFLNTSKVNQLNHLLWQVLLILKQESKDLPTARLSFVRADMTDKHNISVRDDIAEAIKQANSDGLGASVLTRESTAIALFTFIHDDTREVVKN